MQFKAVTVIVAICLTLPGAPPHAQVARSGGSASTAAMQQLQELASERTALQAQLAKSQKDLEDLRRERDALKSGQAGTVRRAQQSEAAVRQIQQDAAAKQKTADDGLTRAKQQLEQLVAKYRELAQTLHDTETDRSVLQQKLATQDQTLKVCTDDNAGLYNLNAEVLTHFEHQSAFAGLTRAEPFTQIARTRLENTALEYKQRAQELKVHDAHAKPGDRTGM